MRKKSSRCNSRKFRFRSVFSRRRVSDEGDWFHFDSDPAPVKARPRKRIRRRLLVVKVAALACLSVSIPFASKWGYGKVFFQNEEFVLKALQIQTDGSLSVTRLAEIANVAAGMNLMDLDLNLIQEQIGTLPQVEKVTVTRELPDRLQLVVRERIPVAWLSSPPLGIRPWDMERGFLLDESGHLFRCLDLNDGMKTLPVIESFKLAEPVEGSKIESPGVLAGIKLILDSTARFPEEGLTVRDVRVRDEWAMECRYANDLLVTYGIYDYERGLDDLALILDRMTESGRVVTSVNVAAEKNIPVTFAAVETPPSSPLAEVASPGESGNPAPTADEVAQEKHLRSILKGG